MRNFAILGLVLILCTISLFAQTNDVKYRRSSLTMILMETPSFPNKNEVIKSWDNYPFPDKYNDHAVDVKLMLPSKYNITKAEKEIIDDSKSKLGNLISKSSSETKLATSNGTGSIIDDEIKYMPIKIEKFIKETDLAKKLVAKWFNVNSDGKMDMELVQERGFYNASEMDAAIASGSERGLASLGDAGEELISKTFVTFHKLNFVSNEHSSRVMEFLASIAAYKINIPVIQLGAQVATKLVCEKMKEGYSVWTHTWLYQLEWNDSIANAFWEMWNDKEAFDNTDMFKLKYIGVNSSQSLVTFSLKKEQQNRTQEQIINLATVRNIDKVFANLQRKYDEFKPITPVTSSTPITAKIGLKEGIQPGDKFEVLEMNWDEKERKTIWKRVGKCEVDKKFPIWDNRFNAGTPPKPQKDENGSIINATVFKSSKKIQPGMLLKQIK